jgi:hypothetical protein
MVHRLKTPQTRKRYTVEERESSENLDDDMEEQSYSNYGKVSNYKAKIQTLNPFKKFNVGSKVPLTKDESSYLQEEINGLKEENKHILSELKDFKIKYALAVENKNETEQSMLNEIKVLHSRLGGDIRQFEVDSDTRSNFDPGVFNLDDIRRESYSKPLSEFGESSVKMFSYSEKKGIRRRNYR